MKKEEWVNWGGVRGGYLVFKTKIGSEKHQSEIESITG